MKGKGVQRVYFCHPASVHSFEKLYGSSPMAVQLPNSLSLFEKKVEKSISQSDCEDQMNHRFCPGF